MRDEQIEPGGETRTSAARTPGGLSRREFIHLNLALIALAGTPACSGPPMPADTRRRIRLLRADDLLSLHVELGNLEIVDRSYRPALLRRSVAGKDAFLVVHFTGQHIVEKAFDEAGDSTVTLPACARIARPTELALRLPPELDAIDLTLEALLDWERFELQASPVGPDSDDQQADPTTRIELPSGLVLAPQGRVLWRHAVHPVSYNGRVELWHTRMLDSRPGAPTCVRIQSPGYTQKYDFPTSLQQDDRERLVGKRAQAHTLILSPMGGWLDVRGRWESAAARDITRWQQRVNAGQDAKVVLEYSDGFLYPFGHRATVLTVTERQIVTTPRGDTAVLRKRDFVVVKTPTVSYTRGEMVFEKLTVETTVTPALRIADKTADAFWIETSPGKPFLFQMSADDWDQAQLSVQTAAVFVQADTDLTAATRLYTDAGYQPYRQIPLQGQAAVVAPFKPERRADRGESPGAEKPLRTAGDTTLQLLLLELSASPNTGTEDSAPFTCQTAAMLARLPALEPYLDDVRNRGWFSLRDPDRPDNIGEVFAMALPEEDRLPHIPMYFDEQADLSGGLAAPSFNVDGLSRIHGPVGQAERVAAGKAIGAADYFAPGRANLLGGFSLAAVLPRGGSGASLAIPRIELILGRKQPADKPNPDPEPEPAYWEAGIGLSWKIPLASSTFEQPPLIGFEAKPKCALEIEVKATRRLGRRAAGDERKPAAADNKASTSDGDKQKSAVKLTAAGKISNFALALNLNDSDRLRINFDHIAVKLGPPKPPKDKNKREGADDRDAKKPDRAVEPEIEFKLAKIDATGALRFIAIVIAAAANLPRPPQRDEAKDSGAYPAKLPGKGDADLSVTLGPFEAPKFRLLQFEVSNVSAELGIGLNFLPRADAGGDEPRVPDNVFSIRVASAKKPLTLLSAPWGGIAHLGLNFTTRQLTAFQYSMGVVYRAEFDLTITKATCEGALAAMFTYVAKAEPHYQLDLILKLSGQAKLWFIDIYLLLVTVGSWADNVWSFDATLTVRVHVGFFTVEASYGFHYTIADHRNKGNRSGDPLLSQGPSEEMTEGDWLAYRSAFAGVRHA